MRKRILIYFSFLIRKPAFILTAASVFNFSFVQAQRSADTALSAAAIKTVLNGLWAGPDESYFFLFRGDSVKEWESEGADSAAKPWCSFTVDKTPCDTISLHIEGATGFFFRVTCSSLDNEETKCYFIQYVDAVEFKIGVKGKYDESGHLKKLK